MTKTTTMTETQAKLGRFRPVTSTYVKSEYRMLQNAINDFRQSNIQICLVKQPGGLELWRAQK